jgi:hypothetical protein
MLGPVTPAAEAVARDPFFAYEGSTFYMSRDGRDREFAAMHVPKELQQRWLKEMTAERVAALGLPGGWRSVSFFLHHNLAGHLSTVLDQVPLGKPWERTAYLELAAKYAEQCASRANLDTNDLRGALHAIRERADAMDREYRMRGQRQRLAKLSQKLATRMSE